MAKKTKTIEIKDLPILNVNGVNYYAFNMALKYLKQNNKEQFKGVTMKKFKEIYGEDSVFKLVGCGSWIEVELFNELSNKMTKVVVKTLDQTVKSKLSGASFCELLFVKDEVTRKAHEQLVTQIPAKAMEEVERFELSTLKDNEKLMKAIDNIIEITKDFHKHGYTSVRPYIYENGKGYLIGQGVLLAVNDWGYNYSTFEDEGDWEADKIGKLCRYVEEWEGVAEHMQEFVPCDVDFSGMAPNEAIIECWNRGLFVDECDFMQVNYSSIDIDVNHDELLHLVSGAKYDRPQHLVKNKRLVDLTQMLEQAGIVIDDSKVAVVEEYEPTVIEAEYYEIVEVEQQVEVVSEPISDYENQATFNDTEEVELVVEQEVETLTDVENEVYECDDNEEFNPYKEAEKMGFDLNSERYNTNDIEFKGCRTIEEIDKQLDLIMKQCGRDLSDVQHKRFVNCADFWALKLLAKEYDSKNV